MSHLIRSQGGHLGFTIDPKNIDSLEDVEYLNSVQWFLRKYES